MSYASKVVAEPVIPESIKFSTQYTPAQAKMISSRMSYYGIGMLRIAHNSLYGEANQLDRLDDAVAAYEARERLWTEINNRERL